MGRAIALRCAAAGFDVAVHYRSSEDGAAEVADEIRALGRRAAVVQAELTDPDQAARLVDEVGEQLGPVELLVNSAAIFVSSNFLGATDDEFEDAWRRCFEVNLLAPARLARHVARRLGDGHGVIINIVDIGSELAWTGYAHYTAAKAGLAHLTRTLAVALAPSFRVNGVSPGIAQFPDDMPAEARQRLLDKTPLARPGTPDDIAESVVFLATQPYTTGVILNVDGGWSIPR